MRYSVVDLFCGAGGMTYGFLKEKFDIVAGIDIDPTCQYPFEKNNRAKFILKDISAVKGSEIEELYPEDSVKILIGCAPCQPFSKYTNRKSEDDKWRLLYDFGRLIKEIQPTVVSMENVPQLAQYKKYPVFDDFVKTLEDQYYHVSRYTVFCPNYGVPQNRTRLVLLASKLGPIKLCRKTHSPKRYRTVADAIRKMEPIEDGQASKKDPLHQASKLSDLNKLRIMKTPQGGGWKNWDDNLVLDCHKKKTGKSYGSVYGRMKWDEPAPTMTTQCNGLGNGRFGHPEQHRAISLREAALLQTFPRSYKFFNTESDFSTKAIAKHIGNAVPVKLGKAIAKSIKTHLNEFYNEW